MQAVNRIFLLHFVIVCNELAPNLFPWHSAKEYNYTCQDIFQCLVKLKFLYRCLATSGINYIIYKYRSM